MNEAIEYLKKAIEIIKTLDPIPESNPGPLSTPSGRAYEAMTSAENALGWLEQR